jgi:hypothetical protein
MTGRFAVRDQALVILGEHTGFRTSELLNLRVGDVWQQGRLVDWVSVAKHTMNGQTEGRSLSVHQDAITP